MLLRLPPSLSQIPAALTFIKGLERSSAEDKQLERAAFVDPTLRLDGPQTAKSGNCGGPVLGPDQVP